MKLSFSECTHEPWHNEALIFLVSLVVWRTFHQRHAESLFFAVGRHGKRFYFNLNAFWIDFPRVTIKQCLNTLIFWRHRKKQWFFGEETVPGLLNTAKVGRKIYAATYVSCWPLALNMKVAANPFISIKLHARSYELSFVLKLRDRDF